LAFFWEQAYNRGYTEGREDVLSEDLDLAAQELEYECMQHGWAVGYEEGYKKGKEDSFQDIDIKAACTATFEEGR
jgi:flagellar biosynthesis/type III secretory pathway protein FliH